MKSFRQFTVCAIPDKPPACIHDRDVDVDDNRLSQKSISPDSVPFSVIAFRFII